MELQKSIVDIACEYIRSNIANGNIKSNEKVSMREIAKELNISRTPIREAIRKLESEGLIELLPRRGFIIKKYCSKKIEEIYEARRVLEIYAVKLACKNITGKDINKLKKSNYNLTVALKEERNNTMKIKKLNEDFHFTIYKASGNETICEMIQNLWEKISGLFIQIFRNPAQGKTTSQEHDDIIKALGKKDIDKAVLMLEKHLKVNKEVLMSYLGQE